MEHLRRADPVMGALVDEHGELNEEERSRGRPAEAYGALLRAIVGQQLSTKAARTIYERLIALFDGQAPAPEQLLAVDEDELRGVGLSRAKASYLHSLARHVVDGELELDRLGELPDEEVAEQLTAVKGLGQWTADMFLIFHLGPPGHPAGGRPGSPPRRPAGLRPGRATRRRAAARAGAAVAAAPLAGLLYLWRSLDNEPA